MLLKVEMHVRKRIVALELNYRVTHSQNEQGTEHMKTADDQFREYCGKVLKSTDTRDLSLNQGSSDCRVKGHLENIENRDSTALFKQPISHRLASLCVISLKAMHGWDLCVPWC